MEFLILVAVWLLLFILTFRSPGAPRISRLVLFSLLVAASAALGYVFLVRVLHYNPNPTRVRIANEITDYKLIDLMEIAPGVYDLAYINRVDTDVANNQEEPDEWLVFYRYDVVGADSDNPRGPFGAAIYEPDQCRPPAILSYELVPLHYDYLGESAAQVTIENIIEYEDPSSLDEMAMPLDRPEVIIQGKTRNVVTDLNIFRKVGSYPDCYEVQQWRSANPGLACPYPRNLMFLNIGSFRGSQEVKLQDSKVTVYDRAGFERSQIVVERVYKPNDLYGDYFRYDDAGTLVDPKQLALPETVDLAFGTGQPDDVRKAYYPEKTVLAFFSNLAEAPANSMSYTCGSDGGKDAVDYVPEEWGLTVPLHDLTRVAVCEIGYEPDPPKEQNHEDRVVLVKVEEITGADTNDCQNPRSLACTVGAAPNAKALPYGCEWCLIECHEAAW